MRTLLKDYTALVALPHSVFALPFALSAFLYAHRANSIENIQNDSIAYVLLLVVGAAISARTAAMSFNRIVDRDYDLKNPRTSSRELPAGKIKVSNARWLCITASLIFILTSAAIGTHCLIFAPAVLGVILGYSYLKRFSSFSHVILGLCLALAPGGAWWALRPSVEALPLVIMLAVLFWVAGFDILYSCQDIEFDRNSGLHSIPAKIGVSRSLQLAFALHLLAFGLLVFVGVLSNSEGNYYWGMSVIGALFLGQHKLISPRDLSRINHSFFTFNGVLSIAYFFIVAGTV